MDHLYSFVAERTRLKRRVCHGCRVHTKASCIPQKSYARRRGRPGGYKIVNKYDGLAVKRGLFCLSGQRKKSPDVDIALNAEMKSTGEVLGIDNCYEKALIKAFMAAGMPFVEKGKVIVSARSKDLAEITPIVGKIQSLGFDIVAPESNKKCFEKAVQRFRRLLCGHAVRGDRSVV